MPRRSRNQAADAQRLREVGKRRVWVQPKVPFIVFLLVGLQLAYFLGNVLVALFPG